MQDEAMNRVTASTSSSSIDSAAPLSSYLVFSASRLNVVLCLRVTNPLHRSCRILGVQLEAEIKACSRPALPSLMVLDAVYYLLFFQ